MENIHDGWKLSIRDSDRHRLDWGKDNPEELKKEIIKFYEEIGEEIDLKKKYPELFK
ncbi:hypothetical protein [uncultured Methanobrevibacter sp.]|uniref:hypothetical protein n=1 Tax=uncultured Methanobrevibacter sp. TaxID=253161 RepID=UPI002619A5CB|nr:hypothetical protein [uncultured Methanobrevibacter sp.]